MILQDYHRLKGHLLSRASIPYYPFWLTDYTILRTIIETGLNTNNIECFYYQTTIIKNDILIENIYTIEKADIDIIKENKPKDIICITFHTSKQEINTDLFKCERCLLDLFNIDVNKFITEGGKREIIDY